MVNCEVNLTNDHLFHTFQFDNLSIENVACERANATYEQPDNVRTLSANVANEF